MALMHGEMAIIDFVTKSKYSNVSPAIPCFIAKARLVALSTSYSLQSFTELCHQEDMAINNIAWGFSGSIFNTSEYKSNAFS